MTTSTFEARHRDNGVKNQELDRTNVSISTGSLNLLSHISFLLADENLKEIILLTITQGYK